MLIMLINLPLEQRRYPFLSTTERRLRDPMTPEHTACPNVGMVGLLTFL